MFLTINGLDVPVESGSISETRPDRPPTVRGFLGGLHSPTLPPKRSWRVKTVRMPAQDASNLEALIAGLGDSLPFDDSVYGERLRPLFGSTPRATLHPGQAADGKAVAGEGKFSGAVAVEQATVNVLGPVQRDAEGPVAGNFNAVDGAALTATIAHRYEQLQSIEVVCSAAVNGIRGGLQTVPLAAPAPGAYVASCYALSLTGGQVRCFTRNITAPGTSVAVTHTLAAGVWQRVWGNALGGVALGNLIALEVTEDVADTGQTFYLDALQLEATNPAIYTSWADPTRGIGSLYLDSSDLFRNFEAGFTLTGWVRGNSTFGVLCPVFVIPFTTVGAGVASGIFLNRSSPTALTLGYYGGRGTIRGVDSSFLPSGLWHFAVVYRHRPTGSENRLELYLGGLLDASISGSSAEALNMREHMPQLHLLSDGQNNRLGHGMLLDDFAVTPWPMSASEVLALSLATTPLRRGPALQVSGTFTRGETLECFGVLAPSSYDTFHRGALGYDASARSVAFDLEER